MILSFNTCVEGVLEIHQLLLTTLEDDKQNLEHQHWRVFARKPTSAHFTRTQQTIIDFISITVLFRTNI